MIYSRCFPFRAVPSALRDSRRLATRRRSLNDRWRITFHSLPILLHFYLSFNIWSVKSTDFVLTFVMFQLLFVIIASTFFFITSRRLQSALLGKVKPRYTLLWRGKMPERMSRPQPHQPRRKTFMIILHRTPPKVRRRLKIYKKYLFV